MGKHTRGRVGLRACKKSIGERDWSCVSVVVGARMVVVVVVHAVGENRKVSETKRAYHHEATLAVPNDQGIGLPEKQVGR